ncbi:hypothetical protein ACOME3_000472 [Neoechinorhynchus agilis]
MPIAISKRPQQQKKLARLKSLGINPVDLKKKKKKVSVKYTVDCTRPVEDGIITATGLERFMLDKIKSNAKTRKLNGTVNIITDGPVVTVTADVEIPKRYLKYLTRKYLASVGLRNWLRVLANGKSSYEVRYFNLDQDEDEDEDDDKD